MQYLTNRFRPLDSKFSIRVQDVLEINYREDTPQPDITIVAFRDDSYQVEHPTGGDAFLVIEVGYSERNPPEKMRDYMRDGRYPAWRIDILNRCVELWSPARVDGPVAIVRSQEVVAFENVEIVVSDIFRGSPAK